MAKKTKLIDRVRPDTIIAQAVSGMPAFWRQKAHVEMLDLWLVGRQYEIENSDTKTFDGGQPYAPRDNTTPEYNDLSSRSPAPFAKLITRTLAQTVYVDSARISGSKEGSTLKCWDVLQENEWNSRQIALHNSAIGHGLAYVKALPGLSPISGGKSAVVRAVSAKRMAAFYDDLDDEWPTFAMQVDEDGKESPEDDQTWTVELFDDEYVHSLTFKSDGLEASDWTYNGVIMIHDLGICPIVRFSNYTDLDGFSMGEIEPVIPLLRRIDQDTFDRLIVQRFGAWKVRYIAGLAKPTTDAEQRAQALALRMMDVLVAEDNDTKFGTLDETPLDGYIAAGDADLRILAAVTQTPPHHLLGLSSNLQAEALAAAEAGLQRKSVDFKILNSSSHERLLRLIALIIDEIAEATAKNIEIRYRDTESRSLGEAAQALGTLANMLGIPVEMLWSRIPGWSDDDTERAKELVADGGVDMLLAELEAMKTEEIAKAQAKGTADGTPEPPAPVVVKADPNVATS